MLSQITCHVVFLSSSLRLSRVNVGFYALCRRQEIVFIGAGMSEEDISKQLDTALLQPAEMSKYVENYKHMPDPPHPELSQTTKA
jgi:hypothetical protein